MKTLSCNARRFACAWSLVAVAAGLGQAIPARSASPPTVLVLDNFDAATANTFDLNVDIGRQTGTLAPITYTMANGPGNYGHQLQNANAPDQLLLADFPQSTSSLNLNFNGANSAGGLRISFDLDSMPTLYGGTPDNWGCINLGADAAHQLANVNDVATHFGILFRAAGTLQAFDGPAVVSPASEPVYTSQGPGTTNHIELVITDSDGNPFDGVGNTVIEVFVNGGALPVWSFTKAGGYADNYINLQGSSRAHFDNLTVARLPADRAPEIVNPSFEADNFTVSPGYVSGNGPITGWTALGGHGINPGPFGAPFSDNGAIPDGTKVAFLQADGALSQVISGFAIGSSYQIRYLENARNCCNATMPFCEVKIGGNTIVAAHAVAPVLGSNPYHEVISDIFVATSTAMQLDFVKSNPQGGDTTLLIDNVSVIAPNTKPTITSQPQDIAILLGEPAVFSVGAVGSAPLSYQWYFKNDPLAGATDRTLTVDTTFEDVAGEYFVVVANASGSVTSRVARLIFQVLVPGVFNTGVDDTGNALPDASADTHYKLVVNPDGTGDAPLVENSTVFPIVNGPWVANNAGSKWIGPRLETSASAGGAGADGNYTYRLTIDATGYDPASMHVSGGWSTDNAGLDILVNGQSTGQANPAGFGTLTPFTITGLAAGLNAIDFSLNNSAIGYTGLRVDNIRALGTPLPDNTPPFITQQPGDVTATTGEQVTFSVRANGSPPLSYQWFFGADVLPGETGPVLTFQLDFADQGGGYSVEITSPFGHVHSAAGTLTVRQAPAILTQPKSQVVAVGDSVSFSVSANGFEPLSYQWTKNGADISGATDKTFSIASAALGDSGTYAVKVSNAAGSLTSSNATLLVLEVIPGPFNTGVDDTGAALADGAVDPHYQIIVNADGPAPDAIVENSTVFPIVNGPWVANDDHSKWIGPRLETSAAAAGDYTYRTMIDLSGFDPATLILTGDWSTDNEGRDIIINGVSTGTANPAQFVVYTTFLVSTGLVAGLNQVDFKLNNADVGYTGLRIRNLRALGLHPVFHPRLEPPVIQNGGATRLVHLTWSTQPGKTYRVQYKVNLNDANWSDVAGDVTATGTSASKDVASPEATRFFRVAELQ